MEKSGAAAKPRHTEENTVKRQKNGMILVISALDMSWRLALVVLVPIIGGYELDKHMGTSPLLTIIGFALAMGGLFIVLKRTVAAANEKVNSRTRR